MHWYYLFSILPFFESRYSIPFLLKYFPPDEVFIITTILNIFSVIFSFIFLKYIHSFLYLNIRFYRRLYDKVEVLINKKLQKLRGRNGYLIIFVNTIIPLPIFGYYSSVLLAWLLNLYTKKAIFVISLGIIFLNLMMIFLSECFT